MAGVKMRNVGVLVLAVSTALAIAPVLAVAETHPAIASESAIRAAIARHDLYGAGLAFDALVEARLPTTANNRPDPVLDRMLVEQSIAEGSAPIRPILERLISEAASPDRVHHLLLLGAIEESSGRDAEAAKLYAEVANDNAASADQRLSARLGAARLKMGTDAAAASTMLQSIDIDAAPLPRRWEIALQRARAASIAVPNDHRIAGAELARAWVDSADAEVADHAVTRVASDRAIAAARAGDRAKLIALLAIDRANRNSVEGLPQLAADLPICGENGVTRDDVVVIEALRIAPPERPAMNLVWANRAPVGQIFLNAARRSGALSVADGTVAQFSLRCRSAPSSNYAVGIKLEDSVGAWMTSKGAYPLLSADVSQNATQLAAILASRTTRYGTASIMRLPVLIQLIACYLPQLDRDEQARARMSDLISEISAVLDANDAPKDIKLAWRSASIGMAVASRSITPAFAIANLQSVLVTATAEAALSRDFLFSVAADLGQRPNVPTEFQEAVQLATLNLYDKDSSADPRARALALQIYRLRAGNDDLEAARRVLANRRIPTDLCILAIKPPRYVSSDIRSDDYPADVIYSSMTGTTTAEFDLDPNGQAVNGRILVSDPPYIFDDVAAKGVSTIRYDPPRLDGKFKMCRGMVQKVVWKIPY